MTPSRRLVAVLALVAGACSKGPPTAGAHLSAPTSIAPFAGYTRKAAGLRDYLAVASSRGDELIFIDPSDDQPVLGPGVVFPLSIPTIPRPLRVAAASLGDRGAGGADLLVAASAGSLTLQVVETWTAYNRIDSAVSVPLDAVVGAGAEILTLTALTPPSAAGAPRARVLAGVTGGLLVVVDFTRDARTGAVVAQAPVVKQLGFDPAGVALEPGGTRLFVASRQALGTGPGGAPVYGVAMVDTAGGDPTLAWPVTPLDARAPTTAVAAGVVRERVVDPQNPSSPDTFQPVDVFRIYASLDPAGCGPDRPIDCGIVALDTNGLVPDPMGELPYRAPMPSLGETGGLAIAYPPASGTNRILTDAINPGVPLMQVWSAAVLRNTPAVLLVTSTLGQVNMFDLGRYAPVNDVLSLGTSGQVSAATSAVPTDVGVPGTANYGKTVALGWWSDVPVGVTGGTPFVVFDPLILKRFVQVTPGYTPFDTFNLSWQGLLPHLDRRRAVVGRLPGGDVYVALQANAGTVTAPAWEATVTVAAPELAVHGGDVVEITPDDAAACPATASGGAYPETTVAADVPFLAPDAALFPGGALRLAPGSCYQAGLAPGQAVAALVSVRSGGLLLTSNFLGYLGRPTLDQTYTLQYQDERALSGEALVVARKLRRRYYPVDQPCTGGAVGCYVGFSWIADPLAPGPVVAFRAGLYRSELNVQTIGLDPTDPAVLQSIARGAAIVFVTNSGLSPAYRRPLYGGALPQGVIAYDKTKFGGHENEPTRVFAAFQDDQLIDFSPSYAGPTVPSVR